MVKIRAWTEDHSIGGLRYAAPQLLHAPHVLEAAGDWSNKRRTDRSVHVAEDTVL